jgi:hypothetical protein
MRSFYLCFKRVYRIRVLELLDTSCNLFSRYGFYRTQDKGIHRLYTLSHYSSSTAAQKDRKYSDFGIVYRGTDCALGDGIWPLLLVGRVTYLAHVVVLNLLPSFLGPYALSNGTASTIQKLIKTGLHNMNG